MIGVVLWCAPQGGKAVFWCEDQGDLAFFEDPMMHSGVSDVCFDAGDMVQFDVVSESRQRRARNPRLLQEQGYASLPERLRQDAARVSPPTDERRTAEIIPFAPERVAREGAGRLRQA